MAPITKNVSLGEFVEKARQATQSQGYLGVNRRGNLVVQGTTWGGRKVLWLKMHLFPSKVRAQNFKVLSVLRDAYHQRMGESLEEGIVNVNDPKSFTRQVFALAELAQGKKGTLEKAIRTRHVAGTSYNFFNGVLREGIEGKSEHQMALLEFFWGMGSRQRQKLASRYVLFMNKLVLDDGFGGGRILNGKTVYQKGGGELDERFLKAAFFVNLENAYKEHREQNDEVRESPFLDKISLGSSEEAEWMRGVNQAASAALD